MFDLSGSWGSPSGASQSPQDFIDPQKIVKNSQKYIADPLWIYHKSSTDIFDSSDISNEFNKYFSNVGTNLSLLLPNSANNFRRYMPKPIDNTIFLEPVSKYEIRSMLSNLDPKKGSGPDQITSKLLLEIADARAGSFSLVRSVHFFWFFHCWFIFSLCYCMHNGLLNIVPRRNTIDCMKTG